MDLQVLKVKADATEVEQATHKIEKLDDSMSKTEKTIIQQNAKMAILRGQVIQLKNEVLDLGEGYSQSQARMLANLATLDATGTQIKDLARSFRELNDITGNNPFDKSVGGIAKLKAEISELARVNDFMAKGLNLTRDEIVMLARDSAALTQIMKSQGSQTLEIAASVQNLTTEYVHLAKKRDELVAKSIEGEKRAQEEARKSIELEKQRKLVNDKLMQDWASGVGGQSPTQKDMSSFYKQQSIEADRAIEAQRKMQTEAAAMQKKASDDMFRHNQMKIAADQIAYKQQMSALADYYSNVEKIDSQAEANRKASFDRQMEINRAKQDQDRRMYQQSMADMRAYYSSLEKDGQPSKTRTGEGDMDSAVAQFRQAQAKASRDAARATEYLADAERRLNLALDETNAGLSERYTDRLNKYQKALATAGVSADVASAKLNNFKSKLDQVAAKERADELNYLSRAMSVQMGDVAISLASGMNPLLVMIQQGDQIRGVIQQVGAQGKELSKAMNVAAAQIAMSFIDTGKAIGGFFFGAIKSAGATISDTAMSMLGFNKVLDSTKRYLASGGEEGFKYIGMLTRLGSVFSTAVGAAFAAGVLAVGAFGVALTQVIRQENELAKQLALTGGSLGLSQVAAIDYARSLNDLGISTSKGIEVMTEMAKAGKFTAGEYRMVAQAAVDMEKYAGIAIADTVKAFASLKDKPVEAVVELAQKTGMVAPEVIRLVAELREQGRVAEATAIAVKTLADVNSEQVKRMKEDYNGFSLFLIELGSSIKSFYDNAFKAVFYKASPTEELKKQLGAVNDILNNNAGVLGAVVSGTGLGRGYYENLKANLEEQIRLTSRVTAAEQERISNQSKSAAIIGEAVKLRESSLSKEGKYLRDVTELTNKYSEAVKLGLNEEAAVYQQAISKATADYQDQLDKAANKRTRLTDAQREALRIEKEAKGVIEQIQKAINGSTKEQEQLTKAQKLALDIYSDPDFKNYPKQLQDQIRALLDKAHTEELVAIEMQNGRKLEEDRIKTLNELAKAYTEVTGAAAFYGDFLNKVNDAVMSGQITDEKAMDYLNAYARNKVFKPNQQKATDSLSGQTRDFELSRQRSQVEAATAGMTDTNREIAMGQYDLRIERMKEIENLQKSLAKGEITPEFVESQTQKIDALYAEKEAWVAIEAQTKKVTSESDRLADVFTSAMGDLISGSKSFGDILKDLTKSVMDLVTEILVLEPLKASLRGIFSGMGGVEGMFGDIGSFFGGFFADGGRPPLNKVSVIGEQGPELFVPDTAGTIIPNTALRNLSGNSGTQSVQIVQNFTIQGHSADRSTQAQLAAVALQGANRALARNT